MQRTIIKIYFYLTVLAIFLGYSHLAKATHVRAGEITYERISSTALTYRFTITGIRDNDSGQVRFGLGVFDFGDGNEI